MQPSHDRKIVDRELSSTKPEDHIARKDLILFLIKVEKEDKPEVEEKTVEKSRCRS